MAEYTDLPTIIGQMKRAAIDCWMADQSFYPNWGNDRIYAKWGWMLNFYNRPAEDGSGGGDGNGVNDSCAAQFEQIRAAVDARVSRWLDLPDGAACASPRDLANGAAAILGSSGSGASIENSGEISTSNSTVHEIVINRMEGSFRAPFLDKYYTQFSKVSHGLGDACVILEANYAAELKMWPAARTDAVKICDAAREAWKQQAESSSDANGTLVLSVVAAVAGVVSSVVTAGTGTVAAVAALGSIAALASSAVQGIAADAVISGSSYGEILDSLDEALGKLDHALTEQERALDTMLTSAVATISGDLASYDLDAFSLGTYPPGDGAMSIDRTDAAIVSNNMGRIDAALATASSRLGGPPASNPTPRTSGIGFGWSGTHPSASELYTLVARCLELTASEYARGHGLFDAVVEDFFEADAEAHRVVAGLLADEALTNEVGA